MCGHGTLLNAPDASAGGSCRATRAGMERSIALLVEQAQNRLLEEEELSVGWESC